MWGCTATLKISLFLNHITLGGICCLYYHEKKRNTPNTFAEDLQITGDDDRFHIVVLRLKSIITIFFVESLKLLQNHRSEQLPCRRFLLLPAALQEPDLHQNTCIDHTVAFDSQHETLFIGHIFSRDRKVSIDIFHCQDRLSGSNSAYKRNIDNLAADQIEIIINDLDRTGLGGISADISVFFRASRWSERKMLISGYCFTDFTDGGRKTSVKDLIFLYNPVFPAAFTDSAICHVYLPPWVDFICCRP